MRFAPVWIAWLVGGACASAHGGAGSAPDAPPPAIDAPTPQPDGKTGLAGGACPTDQFATQIAADGTPTCTAIDASARAAIGAHCAAYLGWRDGCDGCATDPAKWGFAGDTCTNGLGDSTCTTPDLGAGPQPMFGLDLDGDVDGNDKLYLGFHCTDAATGTDAAPCPAGELVIGRSGAGWACAPIASVALAYVRASCQLYLGWQDNCGACTTAPTKWGAVSDGACQLGAGAGDTCTVATLGDASVNLFGLDFDGNVDANDKLHVGLACGTAALASASSSTACPAGTFVTAVAPDGSFTCTSPGPQVAAYVAGHCALAFGWRDGCVGCTDPPTKWGTAGVGTCSASASADDTCTTFALGAANVDLFGLSPDGDVDANDKLYLDFRCN